MPTTASVSPPPLRDGDRLSSHEFMRRWEAMPDLKHAELIDGIVHMPSPILQVHGTFDFLLSSWLTYYVTATRGCGASGEATWLMFPDNVPQPDMALMILPEYGGQSSVERGYATGAPELIIEISVTTAAKDSGVKLRLYERAGVREYLIVQPRKQRLTWKHLAENKYREIEAGPDGLLKSRVFPGLWLDPVSLWNDDLPGLAATVQRGLATAEHADFVADLSQRKSQPRS
jgi:Uma2 family endonuclease